MQLITCLYFQFEESVHSKSPSINHEAEALKEELDEVNQRLNTLQESLQEKDDENSELSKKKVTLVVSE